MIPEKGGNGVGLKKRKKEKKAILRYFMSVFSLKNSN